MVNKANTINGRNIDRHPLAEEQPLGIYVKGAEVLAAQAGIPGFIETPEGRMSFQAGDYIVTDNPPTHAWPVRQQVFETTYDRLRVLDIDDAPVGPKPREMPQHMMSLPPSYADRQRQDNPMGDAEELKTGDAPVNAIAAINASLKAAEAAARAERLTAAAAKAAEEAAEAVREAEGAQQDFVSAAGTDPVLALVEQGMDYDDAVAQVAAETPQTGEVGLDDSIEVTTDTPEATQQAPAPADDLPGAQDTSPDSTEPPKKAKRAGRGIASSETLPGLPTGPSK